MSISNVLVFRSARKTGAKMHFIHGFSLLCLCCVSPPIGISIYIDLFFLVLVAFVIVRHKQ